MQEYITNIYLTWRDPIQEFAEKNMYTLISILFIVILLFLRIDKYIYKQVYKKKVTFNLPNEPQNLYL
jgi:hypothetical protein